MYPPVITREFKFPAICDLEKIVLKSRVFKRFTTNKMETIASMKEKKKVGLLDLPEELITAILDKCGVQEIRAVSETCVRLGDTVARNYSLETTTPAIMDTLPSEVLLSVFRFLDLQSLGRVARVSRRFRDLVYADCLWMRPAADCIATNAADPAVVARSKQPLSARDKVRVSSNWRAGRYAESMLLVQNERYMPRLQLEREALWVSWGNRIWSHPRAPSGGHVGRTTTRVLKGHTDDVSRFVVKDGLLVSGGRDRNLVCWDSASGEFLFAKRYCHGSEVSAVDVARADYSHQTIVTGSRDRTVKIWTLCHDGENGHCNSNINSNNSVNNKNSHVGKRNNYMQHMDNFPALSGTVNIGDRVWSMAADPEGRRVVVGSAGLGGVPALHLLDLERGGAGAGAPPEAVGESALKKGAGVLDLHWHTQHTFLGCGYDASTRLFDTRCGSFVRRWEEPFDEAIYCLSTDNNMTLVCGTARHGLVRLWDMRASAPVQMFYTAHAHRGQSSPAYSVAFDQSNLYVALDQCLNLLSFGNPEDATNRQERAPSNPKRSRLSSRRPRNNNHHHNNHRARN